MTSLTRSQAAITPLPQPSFSDEGALRHLHLGHTPWVQGSIDLDRPDHLVHEYIRRMMAWLLFANLDEVPTLQAMQLGLGAGSLTRCCARTLKMRTCAVELNPQVLLACRQWFKLPAPSARMQVVIGDAQQVLRQAEWQGAVDALQVDLYDHEAAAPVLDTAAFYAQCRAALTDSGCMTVNLFGRRASYQQSVDQLALAFGAQALWAFKPTAEGNAVLLALKTPVARKLARLAAQAEEVQRRWGLPAAQWVRRLQPIQGP
jgi:spermidine synthase